MLFRVWDKENKNWVKDANITNDNEGFLLVEVNYSEYTQLEEKWLHREDYDTEFNTGITLADGTETFFGDIVKLTDSNWGYGGEYDKTHDGYWYTVITKNNFCDMIIYWSGEGNVWRSDMELVGNIHETKLTDAMKVWIKESK